MVTPLNEHIVRIPIKGDASFYEALEPIRALLLDQPQLADTFLRWSDAAFAEADKETARMLLQFAAVVWSSEPNILQKIALCYSQNGLYESAENVLKQALDRRQEDKEILFALGDVYYRLDKPEEAIRFGKLASAISPLSFMEASLLGRAYWKLAEASSKSAQRTYYEQSEQWYGIALRMSATRELQIYHACMLNRIKRFAEAETELRLLLDCENPEYRVYTELLTSLRSQMKLGSWITLLPQWWRRAKQPGFDEWFHSKK